MNMGQPTMPPVTGHRAVELMQAPPPNAVPQAPQFTPAQPMQDYGIGMGGGADIQPVDAYSATQPMIGSPAHGNVFGGGGNISEAGKSGIDMSKMQQLMDDIAGMQFPGGGGEYSRGGGGGGSGGGGGAAGGGGIGQIDSMSPVVPGIPALASNKAFRGILPLDEEDWFSGGT